MAALRNYARLAQIQFDGGYVPYSTVLQAEQQLFPAELNLAATRAASLSALVSIYQALGGGWVNEAAKGAPAPVKGKTGVFDLTVAVGCRGSVPREATTQTAQTGSFVGVEVPVGQAAVGV